MSKERREKSRKVEFEHQGIKVMVIPAGNSLVAQFVHDKRVHKFTVKSAPGTLIQQEHIDQAIGECTKKIDSLMREDTVLGNLAKSMR